MKVYVAGKDPVAAKALMQIVGAMGHEITCDWTQWPAGLREVAPAIEMIDAVLDADALVLDGVRAKMLGALIETGAAIGARKRIIVLTHGSFRDSIFWLLPNVTLVNSIIELREALA